MNKNKIEYFLLLTISKFFNFLGLDKSRKFAKGLAHFFYYFIPIRKTTILGNLKKAFPDWNEKQIKKTAIKNYESLLITLIEILVIPNHSAQEFIQSAYCDNFEIIENELKKNKGLILLTGHFGNWELSVLWISKRIARPINVLAKPQRNSYVTELLNKNRAAFGNKIVLVGSGVKELLKCLLNNDVVGIAGDQRGPIESKRVKLLGQETAVFSGTAVMAIKTDAPIIFMLMCRQPDYRYKLILEKIEIPLGNETNEDKIFQINQIYMKTLEKYIRQYPEQWFWMHKIWKY